MKSTILYIHDSTAYWTLWQKGKMLQVFCEPVTRELAARSYSQCPWLSKKMLKVRLVIDPVVDQTRPIPAFSHGIAEPKGLIASIGKHLERLYLSCRSLISEVVADDLTRYRRDQLERFPKAMLQWHPANVLTENGVRIPPRYRSWLVTESGCPDYVLDWLYAMAKQGMEVIDVRPVSALFASEDAVHERTVITVLIAPDYCRILTTASGYLKKTEQWATELDARIAFDDMVSTIREDGEDFLVRFVGEFDDLATWQAIVPESKFLHRENSIRLSEQASASLFDSLPASFLDLPIHELLRSAQRRGGTVSSQKARIDAGVSIRRLLLQTRCQRHYQQSVVFAVLSAVFSGYFIVLVSMQAFDLINLRERVYKELGVLTTRQSSLDQRAKKLHPNPQQAMASIELLSRRELDNQVPRYEFFEYLAALLDEQPAIVLSSVSWRSMTTQGWSKEAAQLPKTSLSALVDVKELIDTPVSVTGSAVAEELILISGQVISEQSQQVVSDNLMRFLNALIATDHVVDVVPVTNSLSLDNSVNLPSDADSILDDPSRFVVAVRLAV